MTTTVSLLLVLDLAATFVFALNGALTVVRAARLGDISKTRIRSRRGNERPAGA